MFSRLYFMLNNIGLTEYDIFFIFVFIVCLSSVIIGNLETWQSIKFGRPNEKQLHTVCKTSQKMVKLLKGSTGGVLSMLPMIVVYIVVLFIVPFFGFKFIKWLIKYIIQTYFEIKNQYEKD